MEILIWIFDWPDWLLATMVIVATSGLFLFCWMGYVKWVEPHSRQARLRRRFQWWIAPDCRCLRPNPWPAAVAGTLTGALLAFNLAEPWQAFVMDRLTQMPPTAAGRATPGPCEPLDTP